MPRRLDRPGSSPVKIASRPMLLEVQCGRAFADDHGPDAGLPQLARSSTSSPFSGASRATLRTATSSLPSPIAVRSSLRMAARPWARSIQAATSTVFAKTRTRVGSAPSAITDSCASEPTTSTPTTRRVRSGGTAVVFTWRRQPAFGPASWLSTSNTYGTRRRRHQKSAACEANVLQPETTTTSGRAFRSASKIAGRDRIVVAEPPASRRARDTAQEDRRMVGLDLPGTEATVCAA